MRNLQKNKSVNSDLITRLSASCKDPTAYHKYSFCIDGDLTIKTWNSNMEELSQKLAEEVIGDNISNIFPLLQEDIAKVFKSGKRRCIANFKNTCFMGTDLCADINIIPIMNKNKETEEVSIVIDSISGGCPLNKKLHNNEKMVAIGTFASSLAHGVRNPLNAIKGAVVYLQNKYGHESALVEFSTIINEEIEKLDSFISKFLSTAQEDLQFNDMNLNNSMQSIIAMIRPLAETRNIEISQSFSVLPIITADTIQLELAIFNIINNAIEAMLNGGLIDIKTFLKREDGIDYVVIKIADTGEGIPEKKLRRLGDLTYDGAKKDKGYGIFLSREIVKSHHGKILWGSVMDKGTTFKILIPVKQNGKKE